MKKNTLKRAMSALALTAVAASTATMTSLAAADQGYTKDQIAASPVKPVITMTKTVVEKGTATAKISVNVANAEGKYCSTGMHILYDARLSIPTKTLAGVELPQIKFGEAVENLDATKVKLDKSIETSGKYEGMKGFFVCSAGENDFGVDGEFCSFTVNLPADAKEGDVYAFDIVYIESTEETKDMFTNKASNNVITAYTFTQGIFNAETNANFAASEDDVKACPALANISKSADGYVAIKGAPATTTTTTATTTTTTEATTTTTTEATTTTTTDTTTTTSTTTTSTTSSAKTTTTGKSNSPQTGVAGAGVAVAGLAVALGTAFVLRKKED